MNCCCKSLRSSSHVQRNNLLSFKIIMKKKLIFKKINFFFIIIIITNMESKQVLKRRNFMFTTFYKNLVTIDNLQVAYITTFFISSTLSHSMSCLELTHLWYKAFQLMFIFSEQSQQTFAKIILSK